MRATAPLMLLQKDRYCQDILLRAINNKCAGIKSSCASCQPFPCCSEDHRPEFIAGLCYASGSPCCCWWPMLLVPISQMKYHGPFRLGTFPKERPWSLQALLQFPHSRTHSSFHPFFHLSLSNQSCYFPHRSSHGNNTPAQLNWRVSGVPGRQELWSAPYLPFFLHNWGARRHANGLDLSMPCAGGSTLCPWVHKPWPLLLPSLQTWNPALLSARNKALHSREMTPAKKEASCPQEWFFHPEGNKLCI